MVDKRRYIAAHGQLREILSSYLNIKPCDLIIEQSKGTKPKILNKSIYFNLSHSGDYALLAVTLTGELGIDIECERQQFNLHSAGKSVFSSAEYQSIAAMDKAKQQEAFYKCWTKKEAFIKAIGLGFSYDTQSFTITTDPNIPDRFLYFDRKDYHPEKWRLITFQPFENTQAALAFAFDLKFVRHLEFTPAQSSCLKPQ